MPAEFNYESLAYVPRILELINNAPAFEANQMQYKTLSWMITTIKPIREMNKQEIESFENELISVFKDKNWI